MNEIKIVIEGLNELTEAIKSMAMQQGGILASAAGSQVVNMPVSMPPAQTPSMHAPSAPTAPQTPPYVQQGMPAQSVPVGQGASIQQVPTTATAQEYTIEQLQVAAAGLTSVGKMPQVMGILQGFGIRAMTELQKGQYAAFAAALREAGAQI